MHKLITGLVACAALLVIVVLVDQGSGEVELLTGNLVLDTALPVEGYVHGDHVTGFATITRSDQGGEGTDEANADNNASENRQSSAEQSSGATSSRKPTQLQGKGFPYYGPIHLELTITGNTLNGKNVVAGDVQTVRGN
jgi:hypothetical protein